MKTSRGAVLLQGAILFPNASHITQFSSLRYVRLTHMLTSRLIFFIYSGLHFPVATSNCWSRFSCRIHLSIPPAFLNLVGLIRSQFNWEQWLQLHSTPSCRLAVYLHLFTAAVCVCLTLLHFPVTWILHIYLLFWTAYLFTILLPLTLLILWLTPALAEVRLRNELWSNIASCIWQIHRLLLRTSGFSCRFISQGDTTIAC